MKFDECIALEQYTQEAETSFSRLSMRLKKIDGDLQLRMNGKTTVKIILSLIGGVLGLFLGIGLSYVVALAMSLPFVVNVLWMFISFISCAILGLIAGFFPALKASRTDPINALRYE